MNRTLILSCSKSKKIDKSKLPAIERYDGPNFRLLRRYLNQTDENLEIYILSAKFGLIKHEKFIPYYEEKLQRDKIEKLKGLIKNQNTLSKNLAGNSYFINLGRNYLEVFEPIFERLIKNSNITIASGSSGKRLSEMHDWLYGEKSPLRNEKTETKVKEVCIQGVRLRTNEAQIRLILQKEIAQNCTKDLQNFQSWFVPIDEFKISPKWLVSQLTGLPVSKFHSDQARKVLQKLGVKVQRV